MEISSSSPPTLLPPQMAEPPSSSPHDANDVPHFFRCPISMALMRDPVTISTGVTYERKNIQRWLFVYKKRTCPATNQRLDSLELTPNHTLRSLIASWSQSRPSSSTSSPCHSPFPSPSPAGRGEVGGLLKQIQSQEAPFEIVPALKRLRAVIAADEAAGPGFVDAGGVEVLGKIVVQFLGDAVCGDDFVAQRTAEEAVAVLQLLPLSEEESDPTVEFLSSLPCLTSLAGLLQRGGSECRVHAVTILQKLARSGRGTCHRLAAHAGELYKPLLDFLSDEYPATSSASSIAAVDVLAAAFTASKKSRPKAVEAGAVPLLVELLIDAGRRPHRCEGLLLLLKLLCECTEGRAAFADHAMAVAAVGKRVMRVSETATRLAVKILWLVAGMLPTERVLDEMLVTGAVRRMMELLHAAEGRRSTKQRVIKLLRMHGGVWSQYPCFPSELKDYLSHSHSSQL